MFSNLNRQYKKVNDLFENNFRIVVYKAEPHYYSVHIIRTKEPTDYTACMVKLTSTEQWRSVLKILREINDLRKHSAAPPFFDHHCNDHANTKVASFLAANGYLTTINVCRYRPTPPTGFDALPIFNPRFTANQAKNEDEGISVNNESSNCQIRIGPPSRKKHPATDSYRANVAPTSTKGTFSQNTAVWYHDIQSVVLEDQHLDFITQNEYLARL